MACCIFSAMPLSEPMLPYCKLDPREHVSMKFYSKFKSLHSRKWTWKCHLLNGSHFVSASIYQNEDQYHETVVSNELHKNCLKKARWKCNVWSVCKAWDNLKQNFPLLPLNNLHIDCLSNWHQYQLDSTRRKASEICLRPPLHIYFHKFSR